MSNDPNILAVEAAARALGPLLDELVLVGGCAVGLLITDKTRPEVRATIDVDLLTEVTPRASYYQLCEQLRALGFNECPESDVICRWKNGPLLLDIMPTEEGILTFTNSWYSEAASTAVTHQLSNGVEIKVITAPLFIATKLESFRDRGQGDYLHHDFEDILNVIDGRPTIVEEVMASSKEVQDFLSDEFDACMTASNFDDTLSWLFGHDVSRKPIVLERIRRMIGL